MSDENVCMCVCMCFVCVFMRVLEYVCVLCVCVFEYKCMWFYGEKSRGVIGVNVFDYWMDGLTIIVLVPIILFNVLKLRSCYFIAGLC